jgi:parvulin-like peptidyl-prolyl isomerase
MESEIEKAKEGRSRELARMYEEKLRGKVEESNALIKHSLSSLAQMISNYRLAHKVKSRAMNPQEEQEFIEQTVQEILGDENMMDEIKNRFRERIEGKVRQALENELVEGVEKAKKELTLRLSEEREEWTGERI